MLGLYGTCFSDCPRPEGCYLAVSPFPLSQAWCRRAAFGMEPDRARPPDGMPLNHARHTVALSQLL
eukprot:4487221-Amphidinium_carterae.1